MVENIQPSSSGGNLDSDGSLTFVGRSHRQHQCNQASLLASGATTLSYGKDPVAETNGHMPSDAADGAYSVTSQPRAGGEGVENVNGSHQDNKTSSSPSDSNTTSTSSANDETTGKRNVIIVTPTGWGPLKEQNYNDDLEKGTSQWANMRKLSHEPIFRWKNGGKSKRQNSGTNGQIYTYPSVGIKPDRMTHGRAAPINDRRVDGASRIAGGQFAHSVRNRECGATEATDEESHSFGNSINEISFGYSAARGQYNSGRPKQRMNQTVATGDRSRWPATNGAHHHQTMGGGGGRLDQIVSMMRSDNVVSVDGAENDMLMKTSSAAAIGRKDNFDPMEGLVNTHEWGSRQTVASSHFNYQNTAEGPMGMRYAQSGSSNAPRLATGKNDTLYGSNSGSFSSMNKHHQQPLGGEFKLFTPPSSASANDLFNPHHHLTPGHNDQQLPQQGMPPAGSAYQTPQFERNQFCSNKYSYDESARLQFQHHINHQAYGTGGGRRFGAARDIPASTARNPAHGTPPSGRIVGRNDMKDVIPSVVGMAADSTYDPHMHKAVYVAAEMILQQLASMKSSTTRNSGNIPTALVELESDECAPGLPRPSQHAASRMDHFSAQGKKPWNDLSAPPGVVDNRNERSNDSLTLPYPDQNNGLGNPDYLTMHQQSPGISHNNNNNNVQTAGNYAHGSVGNRHGSYRYANNANSPGMLHGNSRNGLGVTSGSFMYGGVAGNFGSGPGAVAGMSTSYTSPNNIRSYGSHSLSRSNDPSPFPPHFRDFSSQRSITDSQVEEIHRHLTCQYRLAVQAGLLPPNIMDIKLPIDILNMLQRLFSLQSRLQATVESYRIAKANAESMTQGAVSQGPPGVVGHPGGMSTDSGSRENGNAYHILQLIQRLKQCIIIECQNISLLYNNFIMLPGDLSCRANMPCLAGGNAASIQAMALMDRCNKNIAALDEYHPIPSSFYQPYGQRNMHQTPAHAASINNNNNNNKMYQAGGSIPRFGRVGSTMNAANIPDHMICGYNSGNGGYNDNPCNNHRNGTSGPSAVPMDQMTLQDLPTSSSSMYQQQSYYLSSRQHGYPTRSFSQHPVQVSGNHFHHQQQATLTTNTSAASASVVDSAFTNNCPVAKSFPAQGISWESTSNSNFQSNYPVESYFNPVTQSSRDAVSLMDTSCMWDQLSSEISHKVKSLNVSGNVLEDGTQSRQVRGDCLPARDPWNSRNSQTWSSRYEESDTFPGVIGSMSSNELGAIGTRVVNPAANVVEMNGEMSVAGSAVSGGNTDSSPVIMFGGDLASDDDDDHDHRHRRRRRRQADSLDDNATLDGRPVNTCTLDQTSSSDGDQSEVDPSLDGSHAADHTADNNVTVPGDFDEVNKTIQDKQ